VTVGLTNRKIANRLGLSQHTLEPDQIQFLWNR